MKSLAYIVVIPIKFSDELENLVDGLLGENIVDQVTNEKLEGCPVFFLPWSTFRRVALYISGGQEYGIVIVIEFITW